MTLVPGTTDIYEMTPVPGEVYEEGTLMSKANILDDNSEMDIWGTIGDRTPNDAFSFIGKSLVAHDKDIENLTAALEGKIVTGSYTGNGAASRTISLGFTPKAVLLMAQAYEGVINYKPTSTMHYYQSALAVEGDTSYSLNGNYKVLSIMDGGFIVYGSSLDTNNSGAHANISGKNYKYIAIA